MYIGSILFELCYLCPVFFSIYLKKKFPGENLLLLSKQKFRLSQRINKMSGWSNKTFIILSEKNVVGTKANFFG